MYKIHFINKRKCITETSIEKRGNLNNCNDLKFRSVIQKGEYCMKPHRKGILKTTAACLAALLAVGSAAGFGHE